MQSEIISLNNGVLLTPPTKKRRKEWIAVLRCILAS